MLGKFQKKNLEKKRNNQLISLAETLILLVAVLAFAWMVGAEFKVVKATPGDACGEGGICKTSCNEAQNEFGIGHVTCGSDTCCLTVNPSGKPLCGWELMGTCKPKSSACPTNEPNIADANCIDAEGYVDSSQKCCVQNSNPTPTQQNPQQQTQTPTETCASPYLCLNYPQITSDYSCIGQHGCISGQQCCEKNFPTPSSNQNSGSSANGGNTFQTIAEDFGALGTGTQGIKTITGFFKKNDNPVTNAITNPITSTTPTASGESANGVTGIDQIQKVSNGEFPSSIRKPASNNWLDNLFKIKHTSGTSFANSISSFLNSVVYSAIAISLYVILFKSIFHASDRNMAYIQNTYALLGAGAFGVAVGTLIGSLVPKLAGSNAGLIGAAAAIVFMAVYTLVGYQDYSQDIYSYKISDWQPQKKGEHCDECNKLRYGCSEYQCRSFGTACNITNKGTKDEMCVWQNKGDITGPEITPMNSVLDFNYTYKPLNAIAPPDKGVKILYNGPDKDANSCIPSFTDLTLGVSTNEPAYCKIDVARQNNLSDMLSDMSEGSVYIYNHTLLIPSSALPSQSGLNDENLTDENNTPFELNAGQDRTFFIRCEDVNGNPSPYNFLMQFCVQQGPDTMAPIIKGTNYASNSTYISFNSQQAYLQVYVNEPADCRWDFQDVSYDQMLYNMSKCSQKVNNFLIPSTLTYGCETNLTGIKNEHDNIYYLRCKDQPWLKNTVNDVKRNVNKVSYKLDLIGTSDLAIENVSVNSKENNSIIKDSANQTEVVLRVDTAGGAQEGLAKCQYNIAGSWIFFYNDGSIDYLNENMQKLFLTPGKYNYPIRCIDAGGNIAYSSVGFTVQQDVYPPEIVRAYYEEGKMKIITDEESSCVYSITSCSYSFDDGAQMITSDNINHFIDWSTNTDLFIKCKDTFGNKPLYDSCSIVVRGSQY